MMLRTTNAILRVGLGGVFVFAGALKIFEPALFAVNISNYRMLPHEVINLFAIVIPWIELTTGLMLIMGVWVRASALVVGTLSLMFLIAIIYALARGLDISCGCFGTVQGSKVGLKNLLLDLVCLLAASWLVWRSND